MILAGGETMAVKTRDFQLIRWSGGLLVILSLLAPAVSANCAADKHGEVYCGLGLCMRDRHGVVHCSRFYDGGAATTREGQVLCGKGACVSTSRGKVYCSSMERGAVLIDKKNRIRCQGRCEPASAKYCEATRADSVR